MKTYFLFVGLLIIQCTRLMKNLETKNQPQPFSMPQGNLDKLNFNEPLDIKAYQYDIVCNGIELSSGAIRNHIPELMYKLFDVA